MMQKKMTFVDGDHPRVCGEHSPCAVACASCLGSSPRMRGTPFGRRLHFRLPGIIPAYAGNTRFLCFRGGMSWDHPRVCGEHLFDGVQLPDFAGSSPRMRGTLYRRKIFGTHPGIIPAYAGNTSPGRTRSRTTRDHPRVCGEHEDGRDGDDATEGSSPRMRGTPSPKT